MKKYIIKSIITLFIVLMALPMVANDYLKIYFKDGHTERHYMNLVDNISVTKYDLEGNLHSDYQMQQIVMADTTYSYYLSEIESMSFAKVYEEQVKKDVETVRNVVTPIYEQCSTVEEMEGYLNEIKNIEGVEDAFRSGTDIFVKVRDWHDLVFMYPVVPEDDSNPLENMAKSLRKIKGKVPLKEDGTPVKIAVAFQMIGDARFKKHEKALRELTDMFNEMGFEADFIPSEKGGSLDLDFYGRRMFEYDHVLLDTHGCYGKDSGIHTFLTDENLSVSALQLEFWNWVDENLDNNFGLYGIEPLRIDIDDAYICTCRTGYFTSGTFIGASQNYIGKYNTGFGNGPHIVFNGACKSLSGKGELTREHNGEAKTYTGGSSAVADIFFEKGADLYIGYINNASHAGYTAKALFQLMLDGFSQESAFYNLPDGYKDETSGSNGVLIDLINPNSKNDNPQSLFFFKTQTVEKTEHELNEEFKKEQQVVLKGKTLCYDKDNGLTFGFTISNEPNVDLSDNSKDIKSNDVQDTGFGNGEVVFTTTFNPEPGRTYYYRACTWDGIHYNWGEEKSFTIDTGGETNITEGLVAYYPFNGNANDASGNGNNGTPSAKVILSEGVNGDSNGAYQFGGYNNPGHIRVPNSESLKFSDGATFSAYFKVTSWTGMDANGNKSNTKGTFCIMAKSHDTRGWTILCSGNDQKLHVEGFNFGGWGSINTDMPGNYLNKWTHVAVVFGNGAARLYVDGQLVKEKETTLEFAKMNGEDLYIGKYSDKWYPFNGVIDEVRIYNRALNDEEIMELSRYSE